MKLHLENHLHTVTKIKLGMLDQRNAWFNLFNIQQRNTILCSTKVLPFSQTNRKPCRFTMSAYHSLCKYYYMEIIISYTHHTYICVSINYGIFTSYTMCLHLFKQIQVILCLDIISTYTAGFSPCGVTYIHTKLVYYTC